MPYKNTLVQTLFLILSVCALPTTAMDAPKRKESNSIMKTVLVTLNEGPIETFKVKAKIRVITPESATTDEAKNAYYAARKAEVLGRLQQVLIAYEDAKSHAYNAFAYIHPTDLFFDFGTNTFMIRKSWKTHRLTKTVTVLLETRVVCKYLPEENTLIAHAPTLQITHKGSGNKQSVLMETLREMYPHKQTFNLNPINGLQLATQITAMSLERQAGLLSGRNPAELPDPQAYTDRLELEDLKKMVTYYLSIPPVD